MPKRAPRPADAAPPATSASDLLAVALGERLQAPLAVVLGAPRQAADLAGLLDDRDSVCYQQDLYQAERVREELARLGCAARVETLADLWDLPADFQTVVFPAARGGERSLKIDMVEQAFHILRPYGVLAVLSDYAGDQFFPEQLKKVFGKFHAPAAGDGRVLWSQRHEARSRRRHEITFQARNETGGPSLRFLSRPGVFSYGRFDDGARALLDVAEIEQGQRVLDAGCGCGTNGVVAGLRVGPTGHVVFLDSNVRAVALAEHNARANGLTSFTVLARSGLHGLAPSSFDVVLANPPYYAQHTIAGRFIAESVPLLRPGGRFYLVTKQPDALGPLVAEAFGPTAAEERRGYVVLSATKTSGERPPSGAFQE